jgi:hypothetical protein
MQTTYSNQHGAAILGMLAESMFKHTDSMICAEALPVARAVMKVPGKKDQVRLTRPNHATITVSADLITANSTIVTVDGVATTATVYATSHAATMAAIVTKIAALSTVANAYLDGSNNRIIHVITNLATPTVAAETTLGATQPTWAAAYTFTASDFYGIAQLSQRLEGGLPNSDNEASYPNESVSNILRRGRIYVWFETAFNPDKDTLYVRHTVNGEGTAIGQFRNDADTSRAVSLSSLPIRVISYLTAAGMGVVEINLP